MLSYLIGTTVPFAASGQYSADAKYFVYEADEYDRNFLHFKPWLAAITVVSYDHPDIYPTEEDYRAAFEQFKKQSERVLYGNEVDAGLTLAGEARRFDATLAIDVMKQIMPSLPAKRLVAIMNEFPGVGRRFERLMDGVYTDYAHHPEEIKATVQMALEEADRRGFKGVVAVYEPHQNTRQYSIRTEYKHVFDGVSRILWLPTYLTRENPDLKVLSPDDLIMDLHDKSVATPAECNDELARHLRNAHAEGYLILLMTAGPADEWLRWRIKDAGYDSVSKSGSSVAGMPSDASESGDSS